MPAAEPPLPWVRIQVYGNVFGVPTLNQFYYSTDDADQEYEEDFADIFLADWLTAVKTAWKAAVCSGWTMGSVYCTCADVNNRFEAADSIGEVGTQAGDTLPAQDVCVIRWMVPKMGGTRKAPGRTNISGVPEDQLDNELIDNNQLIKLDLLAEKLRGPFETVAGDFYLKIFSPTQNILIGISDWFCNPYVRVLRNRRQIS